MAVTCKLASVPWFQCWYTYLPLPLPEAFLVGSFGRGVWYPVGWGRGCTFWSGEVKPGVPERCCWSFCWKRPLDFCPTWAFASVNCIDTAPLSITAQRNFSPKIAGFSHLRATLPNEAEHLIKVTISLLQISCLLNPFYIHTHVSKPVSIHGSIIWRFLNMTVKVSFIVISWPRMLIIQAIIFW